MSVSYLIGSLCFSTFPPLNESQEMGGRVGTPPRRWDRKSGSCSQRKAAFALDVVLGLGELGRDPPHSHAPSFVPILELGTGLHRFYFLPRALAENPVPCLSAPVLLCFSGMCFHLKTTLNGALFISCFKN